MRARAICVCRDAGVCAVVGSALEAAGVTVEHQPQIPSEPGDVALFVVDRASRQLAGESLRGAVAPVVVVGDDLDDDGLITLMLEAPVSHLVRDPADRELGITSEKLVSGDVFGLEKYLAVGARIGERVVTSDIEKRTAMLEVTAWAEAVGARRPVVHRLATVVDELLMNALHDAPRESKPTLTGADGDRGAVLRWASDDRTLAVSVGDGFGSIRQRDVIDHVRRARDDRGRPNPTSVEDPGAGLGLYLVLANVASLIVNVHPGRRTEVVCLFDLARSSSRAIASGVRSLHVFRGHAP
jgi:anti-sigma regulatory factor (Ser/Thr protein kinase)